GAALGLYGIALGICGLFINLCALHNTGYSYMTPLSPLKFGSVLNKC
ncbi:spore germination protein, partial [Turicibacter sp.]